MRLMPSIVPKSKQHGRDKLARREHVLWFDLQAIALDIDDPDAIADSSRTAAG